MVSNYLQHNAEFFSAFIEGEASMKDFCSHVSTKVWCKFVMIYRSNQIKIWQVGKTSRKNWYQFGNENFNNIETLIRRKLPHKANFCFWNISTGAAISLSWINYICRFIFISFITWNYALILKECSDENRELESSKSVKTKREE